MRRRRRRIRKRRAAIKTLCSVLGSVALGCAVWLALILAFLFDPYEPPRTSKDRGSSRHVVHLGGMAAASGGEGSV